METYGTFNNLNDDFNNLNQNINDLNETLGLNGCINNAYDAGEVNGLQGLNYISRQYQSLVILLILLYFWITQYNSNYLMNANTQLMGTLSCILDKLVDNAIDNCCQCSGTQGATDNNNNNNSSKHKHRCKRRKCCDDDCCDDEC